ncbi:MAG: hypothetical protein CL816_08930 [Coxiellaceae bacterium]|nr:hypothetical protein [Coxiellaceae bacterium]|tara:strand:+ start:1084 stop:1368 length:285 start_codon:yes stop_codon:yes gene_type:complete
MKWLILLLLCTGCTSKDEFQIWQNKSILKLLSEDRENKELELIYLNEIRKAMHNNDYDAYEFYFNEYISVPRLDIAEELKTHPNYFIGGEKVKY